MYQNVGDPPKLPAHAGSDTPSDDVRCRDRQLWIHLDVQINVVSKTRLARTDFVHAAYIRHVADGASGTWR
jgi:hypothetical protein